jgi:hypothetical protein
MVDPTEKVYEEITTNEEVMETVERIKSQPWVKVVEGGGDA